MRESLFEKKVILKKNKRADSKVVTLTKNIRKDKL